VIVSATPEPEIRTLPKIPITQVDSVPVGIDPPNILSQIQTTPTLAKMTNNPSTGYRRRESPQKTTTVNSK
jgi:hypothetical protein